MQKDAQVHINKDDGWLDLTDVSVFQQQYNHYFSQLKYFGMHYLPDEDAVSDLIQDLWLKIWENKTMHISEEAFKHYLFQSLYNAVLNYMKHDSVVQAYAAKKQQEGEGMEEEIVCKMIEAEVYHSVNQVFEELPDACRAVYAASLDGKSQKEIAEEFSITINTVKKHINNANHYMRRRMKDVLLFFLSFR